MNESSNTTDSTKVCERIDIDDQRKVWVAVRRVAAIDDEYFIARNSVPHENAESVETSTRAKLEAGKPLRKSLGLGLESINRLRRLRRCCWHRHRRPGRVPDPLAKVAAGERIFSR